MSDADLRELERRWKETDSVEDEAAWLRARVQAGELEQSKLELAAYCGHKAAGAALEEKTPVRSPDPRHGWIVGLRAFGDEALARANVAAATWATGAASLPPEGTAAMAAARGWIVRPCLERLEAAEEVGLAALEMARKMEQYELPGAEACHAVARAARAVYYSDTAFLKTMELRVGEATVARVLRAELIPWALGYSDPVRERVEAREAAGE